MPQIPHITFSCSRELITRLDEAVAAEGTGNRSKFIVYALEKYLSGSLSVDMISPKSSYSPDTTNVLFLERLERDILHKDELLMAKEETIAVYRAVFEGKEPVTILETPAPQAPTPKRSIWDRLRGRP